MEELVPKPLAPPDEPAEPFPVVPPPHRHAEETAEQAEHAAVVVAVQQETAQQVHLVEQVA